MWKKWVARTRNPLRRRSDRIEAWVTFAVVMTILLFAPLAGWWAGREMYRDDVRANAWEEQHRVRVTAVLLQDVTANLSQVAEGQPPPALALTPARWVGPGDTVHLGMVIASVGRRSGSTVPIWVDERGALTGSPGRRNAMLDAIMAAFIAVCAVVAALAGIRRIVIWWLDRHRLRSWQAEWLVVGPRWSHR